MLSLCSLWFRTQGKRVGIILLHVCSQAWNGIFAEMST